MGDVVTAFWTKVRKAPGDGCWVWTAGRHDDRAHPHGMFMYKGHRSERAHRVAYQLANGDIPKGLVVRHLCHNSLCVRPSHLAIGTQAQNVQDTVAAGLLRRGEQCPNARLTEEAVLDMRRRHAAGEAGYRKLAQEYGVARNTVSGVIKRRRWQHLP
jgi:hypothetical protein